MREGDGWIEAVQQGDRLLLRAGGQWLVGAAADLDRRLLALSTTTEARQVRIDLSAMQLLDTTGAWLLLRTGRALAARGIDVAIENVPHELQPLLRQVEMRRPEAISQPSAHFGPLDVIASVGRVTIHSLRRGRDLLGFYGVVWAVIARALRHPRRFRLVALVAQMQRVGVSAIPIIGLLSFVIGVVFAYQGSDQLRRFGADIYTVDLLAVAMFRELGSLMAAIIVAGRSGSAITAEIGAMEVNEEIDAMRALGLDPVEVLVLPRLFGLVLTLPLLAFYANFMGMLGGALMSWAVLGIPPPLFWREFQAAVIGGTSFWLGVLKAPFFATVIALVGCQAGLQVARSAESVGRYTTLSVVESIFLVIILDAFFSILFSRLHI